MRLRIKTAKYSIFNFKPRYHDPVKEEIENKLKAAKSDSKKTESVSSSSYISTAFKRRTKQNYQSNMMQSIVIITLLGTFVAWLFYGNDVFYVLLLLFLGYFYFKLKKKKMK